MATTVPHYNEKRNILADIIPLKIPFTVQCEVSQQCNLKCNYCTHSFIDRKDKQLMTLDTFRVLNKQIKELGSKVKQVNFSGWGEPLINPYLSAMIYYLSRQKITENIAIVTNGLLLKPSLSLALVNSGVNHIRISLQGMTSKRYLEVCGKKISFSTLVQNIKFLYEHKKQCQVSVKLADVSLDAEEEELFYKTFKNIADRTYIEYIRPLFLYNEQDGKIVSKFGNDHLPVIACPQPFYMLSIWANGDIYPCCSFYDPTNFGNIREISLREVWESSKVKKFQKMLLSGNRREQNEYPACHDCIVPDVIIMPEDVLDLRAEEIRGRL